MVMQPPSAKPTAAATASTQGLIANNYERKAKIGKGAFADVFLAYSRKAGKSGIPMVMKRVRLAQQNEWQRAATYREADVMAMLKHPFVVPMMDCWTDGGHTVNFILGYCKEGDLSEVLKKRKGKLFEEAVLKKWFAQLLLALWYLQQKGVLHRDIKAGNVFLHADGYVQLGDFGLASIQDLNDANSQHDQSLVGTPHYMPPELLKQEGYSYPADVWSLGGVMYELSAQKPAFEDFGLKGLIDKIFTRGVARLPPKYSQEWNDLVGSMLIKNPKKRPTVLQLMEQPCMQAAMVEACRLAQKLMPDVELPPIAAADLLHSSKVVPQATLGIDAVATHDGNKQPTPIRSTFACGLHNIKVHVASVPSTVESSGKDINKEFMFEDNASTMSRQPCGTQAHAGKSVVQPNQQPAGISHGKTVKGDVAMLCQAAPSRIPKPPAMHASKIKTQVDNGMANKDRTTTGTAASAVEQPGAEISNVHSSEVGAGTCSLPQMVVAPAVPNTVGLCPLVVEGSCHGSVQREGAAGSQNNHKLTAREASIVDSLDVDGANSPLPRTTDSTVLSATNNGTVSAKDSGTAYLAVFNQGFTGSNNTTTQEADAFRPRSSSCLNQTSDAGSRLTCFEPTTEAEAPTVVGALISKSDADGCEQQGSTMPSLPIVIRTGPPPIPGPIPHRPVTSPGDVTFADNPGKCIKPSDLDSYDKNGGQLLFQQSSYRSLGTNENTSGMITSHLSDSQLGLMSGPEHPCLTDDTNSDRLSSLSSEVSGGYASSETGSDPRSSLTYNGSSSTASELSDMAAGVAAAADSAFHKLHCMDINAACHSVCPTMDSDLGTCRRAPTEPSLGSAPLNTLASQLAGTADHAASGPAPKLPGHAYGNKKTNSRVDPAKATPSTVRNPQIKQPVAKQPFNAKPDLQRTASTYGKHVKPGTDSLPSGNTNTSVQPAKTASSTLQSDRQTLVKHRTNTANRPAWSSSTKVRAEAARPSTPKAHLADEGANSEIPKQTANASAAFKHNAATMQPISEDKVGRLLLKPTQASSKQRLQTHAGTGALQTLTGQQPTEKTHTSGTAQGCVTANNGARSRKLSVANIPAAVVADSPSEVDDSAQHYVPPFIPRGNRATLWRGEVDNPFTRAFLAGIKHGTVM